MSDDDEALYKVVVNHEEQYSISPAARVHPLGLGLAIQSSKDVAPDKISSNLRT
jgi:uncharacterized protein YbdZ (MbtH family)